MKDDAVDVTHHLTRSSELGGEARPVERAYDVIRQRILTGHLSPGEHLAEEHLAVLTETSRTPVREALRRLTSEGLVIQAPNRRSYVAEFDPVEAESVFEIRVRLESYAAERAAVQFDPVGIGELKRIASEIERLGSLVSRQSLADFMDLNTRFHLRILDAAGSRQLAIALAPAIAMPLVLLKHYVWDKPVDIAQSNHQHRELIKAFEAHNPAWASACMASHISSTRPVRSYFQRSPSDASVAAI